MAKYDYIKVRVDESERKLLESMVGADGTTSLSSALRRMAFDKGWDFRFVLLDYLGEVSAAQQSFSELIRSGITAGALTEADIAQMQREIHAMQKGAARLAREFRKVMQDGCS